MSDIRLLPSCFLLLTSLRVRPVALRRSLFRGVAASIRKTASSGFGSVAALRGRQKSKVKTQNVGHRTFAFLLLPSPCRPIALRRRLSPGLPLSVRGRSNFRPYTDG